MIIFGVEWEMIIEPLMNLLALSMSRKQPKVGTFNIAILIYKIRPGLKIHRIQPAIYDRIRYVNDPIVIHNVPSHADAHIL